MSGEPWKFSDAALLYAKYASVVDQMWDLFKANTSAFFDNVRDRVRTEVRLGKLEEERTTTGCAWWIQDEDMSDDEDVPYVWFRTQDAEIVTPGILTVGVYADGTLQPHRQQLATLLSNFQLPPTCKKATSSGGQLLAIAIAYGTHDDPVTAAAEPTLALLSAVYDAWKKVLAPISETSGRPSKKGK